MRYFLPRFLHIPTGGQSIIIWIRIVSDNGWFNYRSNARAALALRAPPRRPHDPNCIEAYRTWASAPVEGAEQLIEILPEQLARACKLLTQMASITRSRTIYIDRVLPPHMLAPAPAHPALPLVDAIREVARQCDAPRAAQFASFFGAPLGQTPSTTQLKTNHRIGVPKNKLP